MLSENNPDYLSTTSEFLVVVVESWGHSFSLSYLGKLNVYMFFLAKEVLALIPRLVAFSLFDKVNFSRWSNF